MISAIALGSLWLEESDSTWFLDLPTRSLLYEVGDDDHTKIGAETRSDELARVEPGVRGGIAIEFWTPDALHLVMVGQELGVWYGSTVGQVRIMQVTSTSD